MALLVLGGLAAAVYTLVYAIANRRHGLALAAVSLSFAALLGAGLWMALALRAPETHQWTSNPPISHESHASSPLLVTTWDFGLLKVCGAGLLMLVGIVAVLSILRRDAEGGHRRGWGKAFVAVAILILLFVTSLAKRNSYIASEHHAAVAREVDESARLQVEAAQRQATEAVRQAEELLHKVDAVDGTTMQELWEQLNKPRIELEAGEHGASMKVGNGPNRMEMHAGGDGGAKFIVPLPEKSFDSLARSIARLERMVQQVSTVADQVSGAGTLIGKAMIALNDSIDSRSQPAAQSSPISTPPSPAVPAVQQVAADAEKESAETYSSLKLVSQAHAETHQEEHAEVVSESNAQMRPAWVDEMPKKVGNTQRSVVVAGEYATIEECYDKSDELLNQATINYINQFAGGRAGFDKRLLGPEDVIIKQSSVLDRMGVGIDYIRREIAKDEYVETVERSFGPMKKLHTLIEFSPSVDQDLRRRWDEYRRQERFAVVGAGAGSVLGLIGLAFGLLKVDTWTKGYYTKRLFLGVPAAIIGLVGLLSFAAGK